MAKELSKKLKVLRGWGGEQVASGGMCILVWERSRRTSWCLLKGWLCVCVWMCVQDTCRWNEWVACFVLRMCRTRVWANEFRDCGMCVCSGCQRIRVWGTGVDRELLEQAKLLVQRGTHSSLWATHKLFPHPPPHHPEYSRTKTSGRVMQWCESL